MFLRKVTKVEAKTPKIVCTFGTGEIVEYDLSDVLTSTGSVALPLRETDYFNLVFLESGIPTWPNGMCVCPDEIFMHGKPLRVTEAS